MAVTAVFAADFSSFVDAVGKADTKLRAFETGAARIDKMLGKFGNQFSGTKLIQDALAMEKAIQDIGGVSRLTADELQRAGNMAQDAATKLQLLGKDVPAGLRDLAGHAKASESALGSLTGMLKQFGTTLLASFSVGTVVAFAKEIGSFSGEMTDLSAETGIGIGKLQELNYAAAGAGLGVADITQAVTQFSNRLASGDDSAVAAVDKLGLSMSDLTDDRPDEAFIKIAQAVSGIESPMERTAVAMDLFGKAGPKMLRLMQGDLESLLDEAKRSGAVIDENLIKKADEFDDAWSQALLSAKGMIVTFIGDAVEAYSYLGEVISDAINQTIPKPVRTATAQVGSAILDPAALFRESYGKFSDFAFGDQGAGAMALSGNLQTAAAKAPKLKVPAVQGPGLSNAALQAMRKNDKDFEQQYAKATEAAAEADKQAKEKIARTTKKTADEQERLNDQIDEFASKWYQQGAAAEASGKQFSWMSDMPKGVDLLPVPPTPAQLNSSLFGNLPEVLRKENVFGPAAPPLAKSFSKEFSSSLKSSFGPAIMAAITGGGNKLEAIGGSLGQSLTGSLFKEGGKLTGIVTKGLSGVLGDGIGGALGAMLPGVGALAGPAIQGLVKGIGKLFGAEGKQTNKTRDEWIEANFGSSDNLRKIATEAGVTDAALRKLFSVSKVKDFEKASKDVFDQITQFNDEQAADQARLTEAITKYGFAFEELGQKTQQSQLDAQAKELIEDWRVLVGSGVEMVTVNNRMSDSINEYLQTALEVGAEIPAAMKPILERMAAQGVLTDEAGNKITDLKAAGISFSESMTGGFDRIVGKLDELIAKIGGVGSAISSIPDADVAVNYSYNVPPPPDFSNYNMPPGYGGSGYPYSLAKGTGGEYIDFGSGTPAMLHGKERVMTEGEGSGIGVMAASINALQITMLRAIRENALSVRDQTLLAIGRG